MSKKMRSVLVVGSLLYLYVIGYSLYQIVNNDVLIFESQFIGYVISFGSFLVLTIYMIVTYRIKPRYVVIAFIISMIGMALTNVNAVWDENVQVTFGYSPLDNILIVLTFVAVYFWANDERTISTIIYGIFTLFSVMTLIGTVTYSNTFEHYVSLGLLANVILLSGILYTIINETHYKPKEMK